MVAFLKLALVVAAIAVGVVATVALLSLYLAAAANMSDERLRVHKMQMWAIGLGGVACAVAGGVLLAKGHLLAAGLVGAAPVALAIVIVAVAS